MPENLFEQLVENAIDFMKKSIDQLSDAPKYAVINFCSAVELFLKARLLKEHWSLIINDINSNRNKKVNLKRFKAGDFQSVNISRAIDRLRNIAGEKISNKEEEVFFKVQQHRNKLIHFFHSDYVEAPKLDVINETVPELWEALFYLNSLLLEKWREHFSDYHDQIKGINFRLIYRFKEFLNVRYEAIMPEIEQNRQQGINYTNCIDCGCESAEVTETDENLTSYKCLVCLRLNNVFTIPCPECETNINIHEAGRGICDECGYEVKMDYLIQKFGETEGEYEPITVGYCGECEDYSGSVINYGEQYLCLNCMALYDHGERCEWCNELNAGIDLSDSFWAGCGICEGKRGNMSDD
jgi:hypothetical protein